LDGIEVLAFAGFTGICHLQLLVHGFLFSSFAFSALPYLFLSFFLSLSFFFFTTLIKCIFPPLFPDYLL